MGYWGLDVGGCLVREGVMLRRISGKGGCQAGEVVWLGRMSGLVVCLVVKDVRLGRMLGLRGCQVREAGGCPVVEEFHVGRLSGGGVCRVGEDVGLQRMLVLRGCWVGEDFGLWKMGVSVIVEDGIGEQREFVWIPWDASRASPSVHAMASPHPLVSQKSEMELNVANFNSMLKSVCL